MKTRITSNTDVGIIKQENGVKGHLTEENIQMEN